MQISSFSHTRTRNYSSFEDFDRVDGRHNRTPGGTSTTTTPVPIPGAVKVDIPGHGSSSSSPAPPPETQSPSKALSPAALFLASFSPRPILRTSSISTSTGSTSMSRSTSGSTSERERTSPTSPISPTSFASPASVSSQLPPLKVDSSSSPYFNNRHLPSQYQSQSQTDSYSEAPDSAGYTLANTYTLGPLIAHGASSIVRRAYAVKDTGAPAVAVKIIRKRRVEYRSGYEFGYPQDWESRNNDDGRGGGKKDNEKDWEEEKRLLEHERSIWTGLKHEHVLPLFASYETPFAVYFVTMFCPEGSLFHILSRARASQSRGTSATYSHANTNPNRGLPPSDTRTLFTQVVKGLRYLHTEAGIVHRDMKLENVLVDEMGVCRIADFGCAVRVGMGGGSSPGLGVDLGDASASGERAWCTCGRCDGGDVDVDRDFDFGEHDRSVEARIRSKSRARARAKSRSKAKSRSRTRSNDAHRGASVDVSWEMRVGRPSLASSSSLASGSIPVHVPSTPSDPPPGSLPYAAPELLQPRVSSNSQTRSKSRVHVHSLPSHHHHGHYTHAHRAQPYPQADDDEFEDDDFSSFDRRGRDRGRSGNEKHNEEDISTSNLRYPYPHPSQDIWALGVILYALLSGRLPFVDEFEPRLVRKILGGNYTPLPPHSYLSDNLNDSEDQERYADTEPNSFKSDIANEIIKGCLNVCPRARWDIARVDEVAWGVG